MTKSAISRLQTFRSREFGPFGGKVPPAIHRLRRPGVQPHRSLEVQRPAAQKPVELRELPALPLPPHPDLLALARTYAERGAPAASHDLRVTVDRRIEGAERVGKHKTSMLQDLEAGKAAGLPDNILDRLTLTEARIENFDVALLEPNGQLGGYMAIRGTREQIAEHVRGLIAEVGGDFKTVMPRAARDLKGRADGRLVNEQQSAYFPDPPFIKPADLFVDAGLVGAYLRMMGQRHGRKHHHQRREHRESGKDRQEAFEPSAVGSRGKAHAVPPTQTTRHWRVTVASPQTTVVGDATTIFWNTGNWAVVERR